MTDLCKLSLWIGHGFTVLPSYSFSLAPPLCFFFSPFLFSYFFGFHLSLEHWFESAIHFCSLKSINTLWIFRGDGTVYWTSFVIGKFCMINNLTTEMCFDRHNPPVWSQLAYTGLRRHASIIVSLSLYNSNSHASRAHWFEVFGVD